jgi:hypothetical protein
VRNERTCRDDIVGEEPGPAERRPHAKPPVVFKGNAEHTDLAVGPYTVSERPRETTGRSA